VAGSAKAGGAVVNPDKCPGEAVKLEPGTLTAKGNTSTLKNDYNSGTNQCGGGNSNEAVYTVTATKSGYVKIDLQASGFDPSLYVRRICEDTNTRVTCSGSAFSSNLSVQFLVLEGTTFSVFVDGFGTGNQAGPYTLAMTLTPSVCGNGTVDPGEQCDDSNNTTGDGCTLCKFDEKCSEPEAPDSTGASPKKAPAGCATMNYFPAALSSGGDNDWYCVQAAPGQVITSQTYTGAPGFCSKEPNNTLIELYKGIPGALTNTQFGCFQNASLVCNDDFNGQGTCSRVVYTVPAGGGGEYCTRVVKGPSIVGGNDPIPEYGLLLGVK
jgi:cysteine-rich repeat protein